MCGILTSVLTWLRRSVHKCCGKHRAPSPTAQSEIEKELRVHIEKRWKVVNGRPPKDLDAARIDQATNMFTELKAEGCPEGKALNLSILVLYDLVILIG